MRFLVALPISAVMCACSAAPPPQAEPAPAPSGAARPTLTESSHEITVRTHEPSPPAVATAHLDACDEGDVVSCHAAGLDAYYSARSPSNDRRAFELFERACNAGYAPSCNGLGLLHFEGRGTQKNAVEAARLYRAACLAGASTGCEHLAQVLQNGEGVPQDGAAAKRAKTRAECVFKASLKDGNVAACPSL